MCAMVSLRVSQCTEFPPRMTRDIRLRQRNFSANSTVSRGPWARIHTEMLGAKRRQAAEHSTPHRRQRQRVQMLSGHQVVGREFVAVAAAAWRQDVPRKRFGPLGGDRSLPTAAPQTVR
jgi:hypothetical protein